MFPHSHARWQATARCWTVAFFVPSVWFASQTSLARERGAEVLIYYANETAPQGREAANYEQIIAWLRSCGGAKHARVAESLARDRQIGSAAVDVEIDILLNGIPRLSDGPQAIVFTNRLVRGGKCLEWRHGWDRFREVKFPAPQDENYILADNPLSRCETMRDVLALAAQEFDPARHDYVLISKSHGSLRKAVTPRLAVRAEETSREEICRVAAPDSSAEELPDWAGKLGISKEEYFSILADAGRRADMRFALVYWEACNASTGGIGTDHLPDNVDRLLLIQHGANYNNLLYGDILAGMHAGDRLADAMTRNLPPKFVLLGHDLKPLPHGFSIPLWIYFVPLLLWVGWVAYQWGPCAGKKNKRAPGLQPADGDVQSTSVLDEPHLTDP
jgi:hypothetical protein